MTKVWTTLDVLRWTIDYFKSKGIPSPRVEAEVIIAYALGIKRIDLYLQHDKPLSPEELGRCRHFIKRKIGREPSQYITGQREFWSLDFYVSPDVLIPRPETEVLVETAITYIRENFYKSIIDIGTGSGVIAISLTHEIDNIEIVATDISINAILVAKKNAAKHSLSHRIEFVVSDLFKGISRAKQFDLIVSNPPYVAIDDYEKLEPEIRLYEPPEALIGGEDGLDIVRNLISEGVEHLRSGGTMLIEIGQGQREKVERFVSNLENIKQIKVVKDYSGIDRVVCIEKG